MEGETTRDWEALPGDVLRDVFHRTRHADILGGAALVCSWWRVVAADDPTLWRHIDLAFDEDDMGHVDEQRFFLGRLAMGRAAVDRSAGLCESFRGPALEELVLSWGGLLLLSTLRALLEHCPRLQVLDTGKHCYIDKPMGCELWRRCETKFKVLRLPMTTFPNCVSSYCQIEPSLQQRGVFDKNVVSFCPRVFCPHRF
jgi:hypothetical protein